MNNTKQFIEDAIEGGYEKDEFLVNEYHAVGINQALLSPKAWQAVGKTRWWEETMGNGEYPVYRDIWHQFIDELMKDLSIEEALGKLV
jgi:hypothetical protein